MRWKWILEIVAVLIGASIFLVYLIVSNYQLYELTPRISKAVRNTTGRELTLGGNIKVKIGFKPALVVGDVRFQNAAWGSRPELVKVKRFEVQVALLPLIRGNIEVRRLILVEPDILLETDRSGRWNIGFEDNLLKRVTAEGKGEKPAGEKELLGFAFDEVRIENGHLRYKDGQSAKTYAVTLEKVAAIAASKESLVGMAVKGTYEGRPFEVSGTVGPLASFIDPGKAWPLKVLAKVGGATITAEGAVKDVMHAKGFSLIVTAEGRSIPDIASLANITDLSRLRPVKATARVTDLGGKLTVEKLNVEMGTYALARVNLTGAIKDPVAQRGIDLKFTVRGKNLANLQKVIGQPLPLKGPFKVSGHIVDLTSKTYKVTDLKGTLRNSDLSGSVEINLGGRRPRLNAALSSQKLDLRPFLPRKKRRGVGGRRSAKSVARKEKVFPTDPLPLGNLKKADVKVKLRARQFFLPRVALNDLNVHMVLEKGRFRVKQFRSAIGGGILSGRLDVCPLRKGAAVATSLKIESFDLGHMLKKLKITEILEGQLDLDMQLEGRGSSVAALMAGLNGKISVVMGEGRVNNKYIDMLGTDLSSTLFRLLNPSKRRENYTDLNCFVSRFDIKDGLADSTVLVFDTKRMSVVGDGEVDLKTEELDISMKPLTKKGIGINGVGKISLSVSELARPFKLSGTLANPILGMDPSWAAITIGKAFGGMLLFGPFGLAAVLASGRLGSDEPCMAAIEIAEKGAKGSGGKKRREEWSVMEEPEEALF